MYNVVSFNNEGVEHMKPTSEKSKEIRKKYKAPGASDEQLANSIKVASEFEYKNSSTFGWGGVYMVDRFQSMITGRAITNNTQRLLDAQALEEEASKSNLKQ
ncbi:lpg2407 family Dot/Icm T4SS effector [Pseudomonas syringae]|uniref:lpg2407 family Dot/Icm T4SS effector n=1 Tax=Pseudomonas syringae TaxID=317 RepID=UPI000D8970C7|nr:lpg2407 family Dot/Icm T4SS effector [Pseudomonas syringae]PYD23749.1 type IV secretion protein Dot [Pseudomonas syringae pv. pisi]